MGVIFNRLQVQKYAPPAQKNPQGPPGPSPGELTVRYSTLTVPHDKWKAPKVKLGKRLTALARPTADMQERKYSAPAIDRLFGAVPVVKWAPDNCWADAPFVPPLPAAPAQTPGQSLPAAGGSGKQPSSGGTGARYVTVAPYPAWNSTLWGIATRYNLTLSQLLALPGNARYRANPDLIYPGNQVQVA